MILFSFSFEKILMNKNIYKYKIYTQKIQQTSYF